MHCKAVTGEVHGKEERFFYAFVDLEKIAEDAEDWTKWSAVMGSKRLTPTIVGKIASKYFVIVIIVAVLTLL